MSTNYYIGKGSIFVANRDANGNPGSLQDVGEALYTVEITKEYKENYSSRNAVNEKDAHVPVTQGMKGTLTLKEPTAQNLELILHGKKTTYAGGPVTAQAFPSGIQAGETYKLPGFTGIASALTIVDSAVGPTSLVLGTHYTVDLNYGRVTFVNVTGLTQPFKASFTNAASSRASILSQRAVNKFLRFEGINVGNNDGPRRFVDELYLISIMPASKFEGKGDDFATYEMSFECVADNTKAEDPELGRYGNRLVLE